MSGDVNLDRWSPHLAAAEREGKTLTEYARSHGLSRHTLYAARQMLRSADSKPVRQRRAHKLASTKQVIAQRAFATVRVAEPSASSIGPVPRLLARLPNGVMLEFMCDSAHAVLLAAAIRALSGR